MGMARGQRPDGVPLSNPGKAVMPPLAPRLESVTAWGTGCESRPWGDAADPVLATLSPSQAFDRLGSFIAGRIAAEPRLGRLALAETFRPVRRKKRFEVLLAALRMTVRQHQLKGLGEIGRKGEGHRGVGPAPR